MYGTVIQVISNNEVVKFDYFFSAERIIEDMEIILDNRNYITVSVFAEEDIDIANDLIEYLYNLNAEIMTEAIILQLSNLYQTEQYK